MLRNGTCQDYRKPIQPTHAAVDCYKQRGNGEQMSELAKQQET